MYLYFNNSHHKFVGTFFSTGSMGGGQETTAMSTMPFFAAMGLIFVPIGTKGKKKFPEGVPSGGSAWGAGTFASEFSFSFLEIC